MLASLFTALVLLFPLAAPETFTANPALLVHANQPQLPQEPAQPQQEDPAVARIRREQEKRLNTQRWDEIKRDADRLLQLATELKLEIDKTSEHVLSLSVMKKAEEIEKLSKALQQKMKKR